MKRILFLILVAGLLTSTAVFAADLSPKDVYRTASPGVVMIMAGSDGSYSTGTGSIIRSDGLILTNNHVIESRKTKKPSSRVWIYLKPDRISGDAQKDLSNSLPAEVVAFDRDLDLALVKLTAPPAKLTDIEIGDSANIVPGDPVAAIGHPEGGGLWILTTGAISGTKKMGKQETFQTEASLNRGNSGGPLLDSSARLIGVNTSTSRLAADGMPIVGVNFAVKSNQVNWWLKEQGINIATAKSDPPTSSAVVPEPAAPTIVEEPPAVATDPEPAGPEQEFLGPNGEQMYGSYNPRFKMTDEFIESVAKAKQKGEKAFDELDAEFEQEEE